MVSSPGVPDYVLQQNVRFQVQSGQGAGIAISCGIILESTQVPGIGRAAGISKAWE
jgi:hypothetical protein